MQPSPPSSAPPPPSRHRTDRCHEHRGVHRADTHTPSLRRRRFRAARTPPRQPPPDHNPTASTTASTTPMTMASPIPHTPTPHTDQRRCPIGCDVAGSDRHRPRRVEDRQGGRRLAVAPHATATRACCWRPSSTATRSTGCSTATPATSKGVECARAARTEAIDTRTAFGRELIAGQWAVRRVRRAVEAVVRSGPRCRTRCSCSAPS